MASSQEHKSSCVQDGDEIVDIIDTHIHLWDVDTVKRSWLSSKGLEQMNRTFDINEYYTMLNNQRGPPFLNLKCGIFMETDPADEDIEKEIAEVTVLCRNPNNKLRAMIVKLDPAQPQKDFAQKFAALKKNPFICGFRKVLLNHGFADGKIPQTFVNNLKSTANHWPFDICINIELLHSVHALASALPQQTFVVDHMANHHQICGNAELEKEWRAQVEKLSAHKNVCIKLSALTGGQPGLEVAKGWSFEGEAEHVDFVVKHFDADRIVYGSDWPISLMPLMAIEKSRDFLTLWTLNLYNHLKGNYSKAFCDKVFVQNPTRIYQLK